MLSHFKQVYKIQKALKRNVSIDKLFVSSLLFFKILIVHSFNYFPKLNRNKNHVLRKTEEKNKTKYK